MRTCIKEYYRPFFNECIHLFRSEHERLKVRYDSNKKYSEDDLSALINSSRPDDYANSALWFSNLSNDLEKLWGGSAPTEQDHLNEAYKLLATQVSERDGGPLKFEEQDVVDLIKTVCDLDDRCESYIERRFTFFRPNYGEMDIGDNEEKTLNLRIDDTYLKYESLFGANIATFCHLLRSVCRSNVGMLSRIILSRSLLEMAMHTFYLSRRINDISSRIKDFPADKSIRELEIFRNQFVKGLFGNSTLNVDPDGPKPYNILTCMQILKSDSGWDFTFEEIEKIYGILSDFAHPNFAMRSSVVGLGPAPGDYFSYEVFIDQAFAGDSRSPEIFHHLLNAIEISVQLINGAYGLKEVTREALNKKTFNTKRHSSSIKLLALPVRRQ